MRRSAALTISTLLLAIAAAGVARAQDTGAIAGRVLDVASGQPIEGASVTVTWPPPPDGSAARKETRVTDPDGAWEVVGVPGGTYVVRIEKPGYKPAQIGRFVVKPGESPRADLSLTAVAPDEPDLPAGVEEFVVVGTKAEAIEASRADSDQLLNTLSAEEFSKFAASDVADALKFVPGVNVVKGQFAIIRGLEDRYSSTLYNGAPIPSPDPDRQSVQLDLFPAEVVTNLAVSKTFAPELPSNSSAGSINIITHDYPEEVEARLTAGVGVNSNAKDQFIDFDGGSSVGRLEEGYGDVLGSEFGVSLAGRSTARERETRFKLVLNREVESHTATGVAEAREPQAQGTLNTVGRLSRGELNLSDGRFETLDSAEETQVLGYGGFGIDVDQEGNHKLDVSAFYTRKEEEAVDTKSNGTIPGFDYGVFEGSEPNPALFDCCRTPGAWITRIRSDPFDSPSRGPLYFTNFGASTAFERDRDLVVTQLNGDHALDSLLDGLHVGWTANYASTTQDELARGTRIFFEPTDTTTVPSTIPPSLASLGPGRFAAPKDGIVFSGADVEERQYFVRFDADYTRDVLDSVSLTFDLAGWYENADRDVTATFLQTPSIDLAACLPVGACAGTLSQFVMLGDTPREVGHSTFQNLLRDNETGGYESQRDTTSDAEREIGAGAFGVKATLFQDVDLLGGARIEQILIESNNSPYTGELRFGAPAIFPEAYLFFDRLDNIGRGEFLQLPGVPYNDEIIGLPVRRDPNTGFVDLLTRAQIDEAVNGKIDESRVLPSFSFAYRPTESTALRAAYSQTVARPSFREMGYYVSVEPGTDDVIFGNPQLQLSDVESYDVRGEWTGDLGDLAAASLFYKRIDDPIESIVLRNPLNLEAGALFRTFFNNPNVARLWGLELETRKNLGFVPLELAQYFSLGANFTYIDAEVGRTQAELARSRVFFGGEPNPKFSGMKATRRLFGQPEWIANADLSFDQPDWGTKVTLAFFAISDVLDAAGVANVGPNGDVASLTLDRYVDSFSRLDLIMSQTIHSETLGTDVTFKLSGKNLTDTTRRLVYDRAQTADRVAERSYKLGRDFKLTMTFAY